VGLPNLETDAELYEQIEKILHNQKHALMKQLKQDTHQQDEQQTLLLNQYMQEDLPKQLQSKPLLPPPSSFLLPSSSLIPPPSSLIPSSSTAPTRRATDLVVEPVHARGPAEAASE
jgi:hypothetical protein